MLPLLCDFSVSLGRIEKNPISNGHGRHASQGSLLPSHPIKHALPHDQCGEETQHKFALWILFTSGSCISLVIATLVQIHNS